MSNKNRIKKLEKDFAVSDPLAIIRLRTKALRLIYDIRDNHEGKIDYRIWGKYRNSVKNTPQYFPMLDEEKKLRKIKAFDNYDNKKSTKKTGA